MEDLDAMKENIDNLKKFEELLDGNENPSRQELFDLIDNAEFSEEVKENLRNLIRGNLPQVPGVGSGAFMAVIFVLLIFSIILFFGYKLYKSIKEKELKKEEKKKAKQLKKKK